MCGGGGEGGAANASKNRSSLFVMYDPTLLPNRRCHMLASASADRRGSDARFTAVPMGGNIEGTAWSRLFSIGSPDHSACWRS